MTKSNNRHPRIFIAGGYGLVGSNIARHIRRIDKTVEITLAGRNPDKGAALSEELGNTGIAKLDVEDSINPDDFANYDLIIQALQDRSGRLAGIALERDIAHLDFAKMVHEIPPSIFAALKKIPKRPMVQTSHWMAGVLTLVAQKTAEPFQQIERIEATGLYDPLDPVGPMVSDEMDGYTQQALFRENGKWLWVDSENHSREIQISGEITVTGFPMPTLDVLSLSSLTDTPNIRFDFAQGVSAGTRAGKEASHDFYIDIEGTLHSGESVRRRTIVSDPNGQAHCTALGALVSTERILGLDGKPPAKGGLYLPETLVQADAAIERFKQFGVSIQTSVQGEK